MYCNPRPKLPAATHCFLPGSHWFLPLLCSPPGGSALNELCFGGTPLQTHYGLWAICPIGHSRGRQVGGRCTQGCHLHQRSYTTRPWLWVPCLLLECQFILPFFFLTAVPVWPLPVGLRPCMYSLFPWGGSPARSLYLVCWSRGEVFCISLKLSRWFLISELSCC